MPPRLIGSSRIAARRNRRGRAPCLADVDTQILGWRRKVPAQCRHPSPIASSPARPICGPQPRNIRLKRSAALPQPTPSRIGSTTSSMVPGIATSSKPAVRRAPRAGRGLMEGVRDEANARVSIGFRTSALGVGRTRDALRGRAVMHALSARIRRRGPSRRSCGRDRTASARTPVRAPARPGSRPRRRAPGRSGRPERPATGPRRSSR